MVSFILPGNSASGGYEVANSCRFDGSSDYLNRTPSSAGNLRTMTFSFWMKRARLEQDAQRIFSIFNNGGGDQFWLRTADSSNDYIDFFSQSSSSQTLRLVSNARLRDLSAWYHIVIAVDTTQGTDSNRIKMYINGVQQTSFSTASYPSQNTDLEWNKAIPNMIGAQQSGGSSEFIDMYLAEVCFIDGQQLAADQFGEFDEDTNIWKPINVSGLTFGTNGFYLDFENASSLGADVSGNGNNWTVNNLTSIDQTTDTCTNNFCTFTPNFKSDWTLSEGNLKCERTTGTSMIVGTSIMPTTGKWYFEVKIGEAGDSDRSRVGVINYQSILDNSDYTGVINTPSQVLKGVVTSCKVAKHFEATGSGVTEYTASGAFADDDIVQFAMDLDNKAIYIGRNGTFLTQTGSSGGDPTSGSSKTGAISTNTTIMDGSPMTVSTGLSVGSGSDTSTMLFNFGNPPFSISSGNSDANGYGNFEYSVPSGYYSLCTKNLAEYG